MTVLVTSAAFACGGTTTGHLGAKDAGSDVKDTGFPDVVPEAPEMGDSGTNCGIMGMGTGVGFESDPVQYCLMQAVLGDQHDNAFNAKAGTASTWNYKSELVDPGEGGGSSYDVLETASYGSSCADFYHWSQLYANAPDFPGGGTAWDDMVSVAGILEKEMATLPSDYDGELYFNLKNMSATFRAQTDKFDADQMDAFALAYGKQIYANFFHPLPLFGADAGPTPEGGPKPDAGPMPDGGPMPEGGPKTDGGPKLDAAADAGSCRVTGPSPDPSQSGDGIIGVYQGPSGILYEPRKVVTAAYALLALANDNPSDPDAPKWIAAARQALDHLYDKARDPATTLYYAALLTTGGASDGLATVTSPPDLLSADVAATIALWLVRTQELVAGNTAMADAGSGPDVMIPLDAALTGVLAPMADFPFFGRTRELIFGMDPLWDGSVVSGGTALGGYRDGIVASTKTLVTTKSTRPNAYMFGALHLYVYLTADTCRGSLRGALRTLLTNSNPDEPVGAGNGGKNTTFINVVGVQTSYFETVNQNFTTLDQDAAGDPQSYSAAAVAAVISGFNDEFVGFMP